MTKNDRYPMHQGIGSDNSSNACGAKTRTGGRCKNHPIAGKSRCRMHGGLSPVGENHWNYKHGYHTREARKERSEAMRLLRQYIGQAKDKYRL